MINRKQLANGNIEFQDFAASSGAPTIGQFVEVPMNNWGSVVARYEIISVNQVDCMVVAVARPVL